MELKSKIKTQVKEKSIINTKNVLKIKKNKKKNILNKNKNNEKIIEKCNKILLKENNQDRDIYLKIDEINNNEKKTIVYFVDNFYPCVDGVLVVMENYLKYMEKYFNIVVCAPNHKNQHASYDKYFVIFSDSIYLKKQGYDLAFPQLDNRFQKFISLLKIDLIHIHSPFNMGTFGLNLAKKRKIPCFSTFHSQYKRDFYEAVKNKGLATILTKIILYIYEKSTLCLTMNEFSKNLMYEYGLKNKVEIIPNATNIEKKIFKSDYEKSILNKYKINQKKFNIIYIGRLVSVKNIYFILEVLKELQKSNKDFNFIFVGDGPEKNKMKSFCEKNNLEDKVIFAGKILDEDEKAIIIKNSKLLFFPSEYDTDGIVKMECACYDVPSLCLENTGAASNIINNHNGFLEKKDIKACVDKINFLTKNVEIVEKVGKTSNLEIYKTWDTVCNKLKCLYEFYMKRFK